MLFNENEWMDERDLSSIIEGKKDKKRGIYIMIITIIIINLLFRGTDFYIYSYGLLIIGLTFLIDGIKIINKTKKETESKLNLSKEIFYIINGCDGSKGAKKEELNRINKLINNTYNKQRKPKKIYYLLRRYCLEHEYNFFLSGDHFHFYFLKDIEGKGCSFYDGKNTLYNLGGGPHDAGNNIALLPEFGFCDWLIEKGFIDCDKLKKGIQWENYNIKNVGNSLIYNVNTLYYNLFLIDTEHIALFDYDKINFRDGTDKKFEYLESLLY